MKRERTCSKAVAQMDAFAELITAVVVGRIHRPRHPVLESIAGGGALEVVVVEGPVGPINLSNQRGLSVQHTPRAQIFVYQYLPSFMSPT
jgi:hypothetical protein